MQQIVKHFTDNDLYTFTCMYYIVQSYPRAEVEYTFYDRNKTVYPDGFDVLLREQIDMMRNVVITDEEIEFMQQKCYYLPKWFIDVFLRGFRFNPNEVEISMDSENHLHVSVKGKWYSAIIWEMPILSCVSELMHILNGDTKIYDEQTEREYIRKKSEEIFSSSLVIGDMGTRRRFSFEHQKVVLEEMSRVYKEKEWSGVFTGTSNVWLAMKLGLNPLGTMSHQIISFEENCSSVFEVNHSVMEKWAEVYNGDLGIYLYDCFGDNVFFNNFSKKMAMLFSGLRVDSGNEEEQIDKIVAKYKELGINPLTKQVIFSNGLNIKRAIEINNYAKGKIIPSFGVGTFLTCDIASGGGVIKPMNIVVKLTRSRITESREWHDCVKLSCDKGKTLGNEMKCKYLQSVIG